MDPYDHQRKLTMIEINQPLSSISCIRSGLLRLEDKSSVTTSHRRTVSSLELPAADHFLKEQCWRRFGKARRIELLERDHLEFRINPSCTVQKYFSLAERVISQFRSMCDDQESNNSKTAEDAYVLGHRLVTFLSTALPRHPGYQTSLDQRMRCVTETVYIRTQLKRLALKIDEEQLNRYMENEYEPPETDEDDEDEEASVDSQQNETTEETRASPLKHQLQQQQLHNWESFQGWSNCVPNMVDTDESSYDDHDESALVNSWQQEHAKHNDNYLEYADPDLDNVSLGSSSTSSSDSDSDDPPCVVRPIESPARFDVEDPEFDDIVDPDEDGDDDPSTTRYEFQTVSSFLEKIAQEDVCYETDSEAADSWAQSDPVAESNDKARQTLGEIMNRHTELVTAMDQEISNACRPAAPSPPPPPPPNNSPDEATGTVKQLGFLNCMITQRCV